jgi:hypothetical protein
MQNIGPVKKIVLYRTKSTALLEMPDNLGPGNNMLGRTKSYGPAKSGGVFKIPKIPAKRKSSLISIKKTSSNFRRIKMIIKRDGVYRFRHERTTEPLTIQKPIMDKKREEMTKETPEQIIEHKIKLDWSRNWQNAMAMAFTGDFTIDAVEQLNDEEMNM